MIYRNTKTGAVITSSCLIKGKDWEQVGATADVEAPATADVEAPATKKTKKV